VVDGPVLLRQLLADMLDGDRYNVLTADSGSQALHQSREFKEEMHLLVTGFQMSGMSGIELATAMTIDRPDLIVLIMSGFPESMPVLNDRWHFLPKPFVASQLRALVARLMSCR
jgi:two-component system cell cycle sensor histidine kinase/response regulator CckA